MRHQIDHLSSNSMPWETLSAGVYRKMLNHNEVTGERTALFRFVPSEGASPPSTCHYHSVFEELFVLDGKMTFDGEAWLGDKSYVFHPPYLVHGFNSSVPVTTTFIGRAPNDLDFNYPGDPKDKTPFYTNNAVPTRDFAYINVPPEQDWTPITGPRGQEIGRRFLLSKDSKTGEGSSLIRFFEGTQVGAREAGYDTFNEGFVLEGRVEAQTGTVWTSGDYWHRSPEKPVPALSITSSVLVFSSVGGTQVK